jgi:2-oxoglutarate ferredoxin oxidoreductase subunit beta
MVEALLKPGFSLVEVISPCPTGFGRRHKQREGLDTLRYYREHGVIDHDADLREADIGLSGSLVEGNFVNIDKPTFTEQRAECLARALE